MRRINELRGQMMVIRLTGKKVYVLRDLWDVTNREHVVEVCYIEDDEYGRSFICYPGNLISSKKEAEQ